MQQTEDWRRERRAEQCETEKRMEMSEQKGRRGEIRTSQTGKTERGGKEIM